MFTIDVLTRRTLLIACAAAALPLHGCFALLSSSRKQSVSGDIVGCDEDDVVVSNELDEWKYSSWIAECHGRRYNCSSEENTSFLTGKTRHHKCTPVVSYHQEAEPWQPGAKVERGFDDKQGSLVRGEFSLDVQLKVTLLGAPSSHPGRILFTIEGASTDSELTGCKSMIALVNAVPTQPLKEASASSGTQVHVQASFGTDPLRALSQRFPSFGLQLCNQTWTFTEAQIAELQKLLAIYSDLTAQAQPQPAVDTTQL